MRLTVSDDLDRHPLWSKQQIIDDLKSSKTTIKELCKRYAPSTDKWRGYYNDIWKWRKQDPEFNAIVSAHMDKTTPRKKAGGRPPNDGGEKSWQESFCEELIRQRGNRYKASLVTPYNFQTINQKLTYGYSEYDEPFAKMVKATELRISAEAEELIISTLAPENFDTLENAKIAQTKAWIASKVLEKLDDARWGKSIKMDVQGTVHHQLHGGQREQLLANLVNEQHRFMQSRGLALPAPKDKDVVEGEVIENEQSVEA